MRPCHQVELVTPKGVKLNGIWYGSNIPKRVVIFIHGLGGSLFSRTELIAELATRGTGVLVFNNRGSSKVSKTSTVSGKSLRSGSAHEVFEECVDDIEGALAFAKQFQVPVHLAGHSTGCQKSIYWAAKKGKGVEGIILLAPISDYAATVMIDGKKKIDSAMKYAQKRIQAGRPHDLLPESVWGADLLADAQRFVSLYSGASSEEIFPYWNPSVTPRALKKVKIPIFAVLAEKDEFADRPAEEIGAWFQDHLYNGEVAIVPEVTHSFSGAERDVYKLIRRFMGAS